MGAQSNSPAIRKGSDFRDFALIASLKSTGSVFFVHSVNGSDTYTGTTSSQPFATLQKAHNSCSSNNGDTIIVMPGHVETIATAAALAFSTSGVSVVGLGEGAARPTFTVNGVVTASMTVTGNSTHLENLLFLGGIDALTGYIKFDAADITFLNCETRDSTGQAVDTISCGVTTACDRLKIINWVHRGASAAGADSALTMVGAADGVQIINPQIYGNFSQAPMENITGVQTNFSLFGGDRCFVRNYNATGVACLKSVATSTGQVTGPISIKTAGAAVITEAITAAGMNVYGAGAVTAGGGGILVANVAANEAAMPLNWTVATDI